LLILNTSTSWSGRGHWLKVAQHDLPLQWPVLDEHGQLDHLNTLEPETAEPLDKCSWIPNARAVNAEHNADHLYVYSYSQPRHVKWQIVEILRAVDFYTYQAAQNTDWLHCEASFFCSVLTSRLVQQIPGYLGASPHITATTWPAMAKKWQHETR
jgi:hypothetical protein